MRTHAGVEGPLDTEVCMSAMSTAQRASSVGVVESSRAGEGGRLRRYAAPAALVLGPVLLVAGMALHAEGLPDETLVRTIDAQPGQWLTSHLLLALGNALIAAGAAVVAARRMTTGRGAKLTAVGAGLAAIGGALMALGDLAHGVVAYSLAGHVAVAESLAIQEAYFSNPAIMGVSLGGMLLPLGVMILGIGLLRSGLSPRWAGVVVLASPVLIQAGMASGPRMLAFGLPFIVGMAVLAQAVARPSASRTVASGT